MEKKIIVAIVLLVSSLLGIGHLVQFQGFRVQKNEDDIERQFEEFQWKYNKVYNDESESSKRFSIFKKTLDFISKFNSEKRSSKVAINQFADLTDDEFEKYLNYKISENQENKEFTSKITYKTTNRVSKIDWRGSLVWSGVYDQQNCGSCWAFSSVQALEAAQAKQSGRFMQLSVQQMLECANQQYGNFGCEGGLMNNAFKWAKEAGGICAKSEYPHSEYIAKVEKCIPNSCKSKININGIVDVPSRNQEAFLDRLAIVPLSCSVDAGQYAFRYYQSGVIETDGYKQLNHAVLAVGFDENEEYIIGKNCWSASWGEAGYFRVRMTGNSRGTLGLYINPSYPSYAGEPTS